jgi:cobalt/nickel transport system permease protein
MQHLLIDGWSRESSFLHARDARAKLGALVIFLVAVSTTPMSSQAVFYADLALLTAAAAIARLPLKALLKSAGLFLPFVATFALMSWIAGQPGRAVALFEKSFLSGLAALILVATTPIQDLLHALESLKMPRALVLIAQFLYRYLFVVSEQAQRVRMALRARGSRFQSAVGAVSVLFARSWERADGIYQAMLARGFTGRFAALRSARFGWADAVFLCIAAGVIAGIRLAL